MQGTHWTTRIPYHIHHRPRIWTVVSVWSWAQPICTCQNSSGTITLSNDLPRLPYWTHFATTTCTVLSRWIYMSQWVSDIGFITVYGRKEGHIAPYTDTEFQLTKYHNFHEMLVQNTVTDAQITITLLTKQHVKYVAWKTVFHNKMKSRLYNKRQDKYTTLQCT